MSDGPCPLKTHYRTYGIYRRLWLLGADDDEEPPSWWRLVSEEDLRQVLRGSAKQVSYGQAFGRSQRYL